MLTNRDRVMENSREDWIARRAYELWEQAGKPDGQNHEHWAQASAEWEDHQASRTNQRVWDEEEW
jgi:hypothetical protein